MKQITSTKEFAAVLKAAGWNASKVSVSAPHSLTYVKVKVRHPSVDLAALEEFCKSYDSWSMSQDDVASGQSVSIQIEEKVKEAWSAEFRPLIEKAVKVVSDTGRSAQIEGFEGAWLSVHDNKAKVLHMKHGNYSTYGEYLPNVLAMMPDVVDRLSLSLYMLVKKFGLKHHEQAEVAPVPAPVPVPVSEPSNILHPVFDVVKRDTIADLAFFAANCAV